MTEEDRNTRALAVSREELCERVWQTPASQLGEKFAITGNGFADICDGMAMGLLRAVKLNTSAES